MLFKKAIQLVCLFIYPSNLLLDLHHLKSSFLAISPFIVCSLQYNKALNKIHFCMLSAKNQFVICPKPFIEHRGIHFFKIYRML